MKNRLQFNRIPLFFTPDTEIISGSTTIVKSGREKAKEELNRYIKRRDFTPLIGEPIVVRYMDDYGHKQAILAIGVSSGKTTSDAQHAHYHLIDTAEIIENVGFVSAATVTTLDLASAVTKDVSNHLVILKNMILSGIGLTDGTYFTTDDPTDCGLYKKYDGAKYISGATSMSSADYLLDKALEDTVKWLLDISGATMELSAETISLDETLARTETNLDALSSATVEIVAKEENIIDAAGLKPDGTYEHDDSANYIKDATSLFDADKILDETLADLSGNTISSDRALEQRIEALEEKTISGTDAISTETLDGNTTISLVIKNNDKLLSQDIYGLSSTLNFGYDEENKKIYLTGNNGVIIGEVDATDFIKDGMLDNAYFKIADESDREYNPYVVPGDPYIVLVFNIDGSEGESKKRIYINVKYLVDIYTVSATSLGYLTIEGYKIRANVDVDGGLASYSLFNALSSITDNIISGAGLNIGQQGGYPRHDDTHYIKNAGSLDQADVFLDTALWALSGVVADIEVAGDVDALSASVMTLSSVTAEFSASTTAAILELSARTVDVSGVTQEYVDEAIRGLSGNVVSYIDAEILSLSGNAVNYVNTLSGNVVSYVNTVSGNVVNYVNNSVETLSGNVVNYVNTLSGNVVSYVNTVSGNVVNYVNALSGNVVSYVNNSVEALSGNVVNYVNNSVETLSGNVVNYVNALSGNVVNYVNTVSGNIETVINSLSAGTNQLSADTHNAILKLSGDTESAIKSAIEGIGAVSATTGKYFTAIGIKNGELAFDETDIPALSVESAGTGNVVSQISVNGHKILYSATSVATSEDIQNISGAVINLSAATTAISEDLTTLSSATESISGFAHDGIVKLSGNVINYVNEALSGLSGDVVNYINEISGNVIEYADNRVESGLTVLSGIVEDYVNEAISGISFECDKTLGSGYTYSGLPYVNSSTTFADAYSALTKELLDDEYVTSLALNDLNNRIYELSGAAGIIEYIQENEEVIAGALNNLNDRLGGVETHMTGEYIPITGYELASGTTEDELILTEDDTVNEAFGKLQKQILDDEEAVAAGFNDLNARMGELEEEISHNTGITQLSGAVRSLSAATNSRLDDIEDSLDEFAYKDDVQNLSSATMSISAKTSGVLTVNVNGQEQGKYSPSANTTIDLQIVQEVTGDDVLLTGYALATGSSEEELIVLATDTVNQAFGKLQKQNYDNEAVVAGALNDLDERVVNLELGSGSSAEIVELSASVIDHENRLDVLEASGASESDILTISGIMSDHEDRLDILEVSAASRNDVLTLSGIATDHENRLDVLEISAATELDLLELSGIVVDNELVTAAALNALNDKIESVSAFTDDIKASLDIISGSSVSKQELSLLSASVVDNKASVTELEVSAATKLDVEALSAAVKTKEYVISTAINDLNTRILGLSDRLDEIEDDTWLYNKLLTMLNGTAGEIKITGGGGNITISLDN